MKSTNPEGRIARSTAAVAAIFAAGALLVSCATRPALAPRSAAPEGERAVAAASIDPSARVATIGRLDPARGPELAAKLARGPKRYDKPAEASDFYLFQRTNGAPIDYAHMAKAMAQAAAMRPPAASKAPGDILGWEPLGPGNIGGRTRAILIDPGTPSRMFAGAVAGGVWRTTDGGANWVPLDDLMTNLAVCTLQFAGQGGPALDANTIYAGTGEGYFNGDAVRGAGVFKTTDGGTTWLQLPSTNNSNFHYVNKIVADPNVANTLFAATRTGVWKTTDGGGSWNSSLANSGFGGPNGTLVGTGVGIVDLVSRTDMPHLIAASGSFTGDGLYRSTDAGGSWTRVLTDPDIARVSVAIHRANQNVMYASAASQSGGDQLLNVYRSLDGGATWSPRIAGPPDYFNDASWMLFSNPLFAHCFGQAFGQGWYDNVIAVSPVDPDVVFVGGVDLFRSDNGGVSFAPISYWWLTPGVDPEYNHADHHVIEFHPGFNGTSNQIVFSGNDGGVLRTNNGMAATAAPNSNGICLDFPEAPTLVNWTSLNNGYEVTQFYHGRPYPAPTTTYFGGTQDNGTLRGTDAGGIDGWVEIHGGDGGYVEYDPNNTQVLFVETTNKSMRRSTNGGAGFSDAFGTLTESSGNFLFIAPFRAQPANPNVLWYGGRSPWRTSNAVSAATAGSISWTQAGAAFPSGQISAWAINPADGNDVWAGTSTGRVHKTTTGLTSTAATTWASVGTGIPTTGYISWIEVDQHDPTGNTVYATQSRFDSGDHVYRTTDGAATPWQNITSNLPDIPVHCVRVHPIDPQILYIGTDLGLFVSKDAGGTWASVNSPGFANVVVEALEFQDDDTLYLFTHGRSVFRATIEGMNAAKAWEKY